MIGNSIFKFLLPVTAPLSLLYGLAVFARNKLFDCGRITSEKFDLPIISVGNITVGGTGKTPHIEYLLGILHGMPVAVVSRGYKRRTKGFRYVEPTDDARTCGDEPLQIKRKYPAAAVAVDVRRENAIHRIMNDSPELQAVLLDDAFQYRRIQPSLNIVLIDYGRPVWKDMLLPAGRLREACSALKRADILIVSKCPRNISEQEKQIVVENLKRYSPSEIYFSIFEFGSEKAVFGIAPESIDGDITAVAGIANPAGFFEEVRRRYGRNPQTLVFADHHDFTAAEIKQIGEKAQQGIVVTTEKDAVRLQTHADLFTAEIKSRILYIPVTVSIINNEENFKHKFIQHVRKS